MSPWLFNIYMDGCIREMKVKVRDLGARLNVRGVEQPVVASLYADDTVLLAESERMLQRIVDEFDRICKRRKLKMNAWKSMVPPLRVLSSNQPPHHITRHEGAVCQPHLKVKRTISI